MSTRFMSVFAACCVFFSDLGVVCVLETESKVVSLQQVQMATHHVQQSLAFGKFLSDTQTHTQSI